MHAVLFLLALFLLSKAKPLDENGRSAEKVEYEIRSGRNIVEAQNVELREQSEKTAAMKKSADVNILKSGLWNLAKKAASFIFKSARKRLATLTDQISSWLRGGSSSETGAMSTAAHAIERRRLDESEQGHISRYKTKQPFGERN
ncbi:unnamed protein product [Cylicocyclus nassatus]|uniref:Uncharacterized protein n=1 Tax=Cylicocyclus nassatus TaxID=53992 RepID=A0AA36H776_CYLNA|nr:unnamed protein product [Cylicocyclus nassatus]